MNQLIARVIPHSSFTTLRVSRNPQIRAEITQLFLKPGVNIIMRGECSTFLNIFPGREGIKKISSRIFFQSRRSEHFYRPSEDWRMNKESVKALRRGISR